MRTLLDAIEGSHQKLLRPSGGCHNCPRRKVDFVPATLPKAKLLWLGEAPGQTEVAKGRGFVGKSGEKLRTFARAAGLEVEAVSNTVHCRPPDNRTPTPKEIERCLSQFVLDEIRDYPIVVLCGAVPLRALFPKVGNVPAGRATHFRGNVAYHPDFPGQRFYSIYHPSYMLRRPDLEDQFRQQLERLARIVRGEPAPTWRLLQGGDDEWWKAYDDMLKARLIAPDFETTALDSWKVQTRIRSLAVTHDAKTVIFAHEDDPHWVATLERLQAYMEQPCNGVVGSNIAFDVDMLEHELGFVARCTGVHDVGAIWAQSRQYRMPSQK